MPANRMSFIAVDGVSLTIEAHRSHGPERAERFGEDHPAEPHRLHGQAYLRPDHAPGAGRSPACRNGF